MLGTSLDTKGGVASVVQAYETGGLFGRWPVTYVATHRDGSAVQKFATALSAWILFARHILFRRRFILHVHCASRASFWRKASFILPAMWARRDVIFHLHGAEFMQFYEVDCGYLGKRVVRYVLDHCARIIVLSESWRRQITAITRNEKVDVIYNPTVPSSTAVLESDRSAERLLFLGRLGRRKGIYVLLDAFARALDKYPEAELVCGGDGEIDGVKRAVATLRLEENVQVLGWVDGARKRDLLAAASVYVLPSYAEGLPMSILEAMSAGLPVVTTPVGGIPEAVRDGIEGFLVPAGDVRALADALCRLLGDRELRRSMGKRAREKFDACFSVDVVLPRIETLYRGLGVQPRGAG